MQLLRINSRTLLISEVSDNNIPPVHLLHTHVPVQRPEEELKLPGEHPAGEEVRVVDHPVLRQRGGVLLRLQGISL